MSRTALTVGWAGLCLLGGLSAAASLRSEEGDSWIQNDWKGARAKAAKLGKPLFVVFRCVP